MKPINLKDAVLTGFSSKQSTFERCHATHPMLTLGTGQFYGGACLHPPLGMDVYVGLNFDMQGVRSGWIDPPPLRLHFPISDHGVPKEVTAFKAMVSYLCNRLREGAKVHAGCIGGHGRTGLLVAAIVAELGVSKDPIAWVRQHYCSKAVESASQVGFLVKHYKAKTAKPREYALPKVTYEDLQPTPWGGHFHQQEFGDLYSGTLPDALPMNFDPMPGPRNIWSKHLTKQDA